MAEYKLSYFPVRGRAEPIRLLFAYKEIKYEDVRVPGENWPKLKPNTPFGSMPVLEEGGKKLGGSIVILRYLGEKFCLAGSNAWENAWLANISDFMNDFLTEMLKLHFEKDENKKKELEEKMKTETGPKYLGKLNEMAKDTGYLCCDHLTWPDLQFYAMFEGLVKTKPGLAAAFPNLMKLKANVESNPGIAKWLAERPDTPF